MNDFEKMIKTLYDRNVPLIKPGELQQSLKNRNNIYLLDIRTPAEFRVSHIAGANFHNYKTFKLLEMEPYDSDAHFILYCSVGYRSNNVAKMMIKGGYKNVYNLYGGIFHWINSGFEVVDPDGQLTGNIHPYSKKWSIWLKCGKKVYE